MCRGLLLALAFAALPLTGAWAGHSGSYTTRRGNTYDYTASAGGGSASGSITGPGGQTASGSASATYAGGGQYKVTGTVNGPRGATHQRSRLVSPQ